MKALKIAAIVVVIAAAVASVREYCLEPYLCEIEAKRVQRRTELLKGRADFVVSVAARENLELLRPCRDCLGTNVAYLMLKAANETALQDYGAAEKMYLQALSFDRRPELYLNLGFTQLDEGKTAEGTQSLLNACRFNFSMLAEVPDPKKTELTAVIVRERYLIDQQLQRKERKTGVSVTSMTLILAGVALAATSWAVMLLRAAALRWRWLDYPNERSSHDHPIPRGGGLAIVMVTTAGALGTARLLSLSFDRWFAIFFVGVIVAIVSWIDDLRSLSSVVRFAVHLGAAIAVIATVGGLEQLALPVIGLITLGVWAGAVVALVWIVGLTNAYNFMDGIDGIAGTQALLAGAGWMMAGRITHFPDVTIVGAVMAASAFAFLIYNWRPASIFMGDVGSAFLGYLLAAMTVVAARHDARLAAVGVLLVWPFIFDTLFTFVRRLRNREKVTHAHRSHLYQRLVQTGLSHSNVSLLYGALDLGGLVCAWILLRGGQQAAIVYVALPLMALALWVFVIRREHRL